MGWVFIQLLFTDFVAVELKLIRGADGRKRIVRRNKEIDILLHLGRFGLTLRKLN